LFKENGLENVSLNSVISYAGVSKGSFYSHYNSKDSLEADFITAIIGRMNFSYETVFTDEATVAIMFFPCLKK